MVSATCVNGAREHCTGIDVCMVQASTEKYRSHAAGSSGARVQEQQVLAHPRLLDICKSPCCAGASVRCEGFQEQLELLCLPNSVKP